MRRHQVLVKYGNESDFADFIKAIYFSMAQGAERVDGTREILKRKCGRRYSINAFRDMT